MSSPCEFIPVASEASAVPITNKCVAAESLHALNPNTTAFTPSVCKNVELNSCNIPLSSDTNHVTASDYNLNNLAGNTCLKAGKHETARHPQIEVFNEEAEVIIRAPPINSIPYTLPETSGDASKNSLQGSLHPAALNEVAQMGTVSRELIIARAGSESAPRASVNTC